MISVDLNSSVLDLALIIIAPAGVTQVTLTSSQHIVQSLILLRDMSNCPRQTLLYYMLGTCSNLYFDSVKKKLLFDCSIASILLQCIITYTNFDQWSVNFVSQHENISYGFPFCTHCLLNIHEINEVQRAASC